jgi:hypothetical protein
VPTYATVGDLLAYLQDNPDVQAPDPDACGRLLERSERRLDTLLGPHPDTPPGELKLDPSTLTQAQRDALARATCAVAEWALYVGAAFEAGDSEELGPAVTELRPPMRTPPKAILELAGTGLVKRSGCAAPSPPLPVDEFAPAQLLEW